ncbi:hypothetical protein B0I37DRAFT_365800 [Chaetomium sp. MPI-CAGE-AT-0009]|nr:hypothetical protein B0I37DRAFT_365800 [Chaetomium sp. MPI-CAGE-AT-0009]
MPTASRLTQDMRTWPLAGLLTRSQRYIKGIASPSYRAKVGTISIAFCPPTRKLPTYLPLCSCHRSTHTGINNTTNTMSFKIWIEGKEKTIEGHIFICTLKFKDKVIWGPATCHDNTLTLRDAIHKADSRFDMSFQKKDKTVEGHTRSISVKLGDTVLLNKLHTHDNMEGLVKAIELVQLVKS